VVANDLHVLKTLVFAFEAEKPAAEAAAKNLVDFLVDNAVNVPVRDKLWSALERLKTAIPFDALNALEAAYDKTKSESARTANAEILSEVLTRQITKDNFVWLPEEKMRSAYPGWVDRAAGPKQFLIALKAECLIESNQSAAKLDEKILQDTGWYGAYVQARVLKKYGDSAAAADLLVTALKDKKDAPNPAHRKMQAVAVLRHAVHKQMNEKTREFADEANARKAIGWLTVVSELTENNQSDDESIDDAIALAMAAAKIGEPKALADAESRLVKRDTAKGYYYLAKAHAVLGKDSSKTLEYFKKTVDAKVPGQDELRKEAARLVVDTTLKNANASEKSDPQSAIKHSQTCQEYARKLSKWDLVRAAKKNEEAVKVEVNARVKQSGQHEIEKYQAFKDAIARASKAEKSEFRIPVIAAKLMIRASGRTPGQRDESIKEGNEALGAIQAFLDTPEGKKEKDWLETLQCDIHFGLGQWTYEELQALLNNKKLDPSSHRQQIRNFYETSLRHYLSARDLGKYKDRHRQELKFYIGYRYYGMQKYTDDPATKKKERDEALRLLTEVKEALERIDVRQLDEFERDYFLVEARDVIAEFTKK
jgi:hypothetical protein